MDKFDEYLNNKVEMESEKFILPKSFEDKIFKPFSKMQEVVEIPKDQIKTLEELKNEEV